MPDYSQGAKRGTILFIVYGVKNYGKGNAFVRNGGCGNCGRHGRLSSYDSASFFTIFWLPLIPLGNKRIMDACPSCKMYKELGLRKYNKIRKKALFTALENLKDDPNNPEKAIEAANNLVSYNDFQSFESIAPTICQKHSRNPEVLKAVGGSYEYIGEYKAATTCFLNAVKADDSADNRITLATNLLMQGRPKEAKPYLDHITTDEDENISYLYFLVEGFRDKGMHTEAMDVLYRIENIREELKDDEDHQEMLQTSRDRISSRDEMPSQLINTPRGIESANSGVPVWVPHLLPALLVCLVVGSYFYSAIANGLARDMVLVNGTSVSYTAGINDKAFALTPYSYKHVQLPEGELTINIKGTVLQIPQQTVRFETPFFSRPFDSRTIVINPDGLALLLEETTGYSTNGTASAKNNYSFHSNKVLHEFSDIDFPFKDFPKQISMGSNSTVEYRTKLSNFKPFSFNQRMNFVSEKLSKEEMAAYLEKYVAMSPEDMSSGDVLQYLSRLTAPEKFLKIIRPGVAIRPVLIEWHRTYQTYMETHDPSYDLVGEYEKYAKDEPSEAYFKYLIGRVTEDPLAANALFVKSENQGKPIGFGYYAMAYNSLCSGQFTKSLAQARKAASVRPEYSHYFQSTAEVSLQALNKYQELLDIVRLKRKDNPDNSTLAGAEIKYLMLLNRPEEAVKVKAGILLSLKEYETPETLKSVEHYLESMICYLKGDYSNYATNIKTSFQQDGPLCASLEKKDPVTAALILEETGSANATQYVTSQKICGK